MSAKDAVGSIPGYTWHLLQNFFIKKPVSLLDFRTKMIAKLV